MASTSNYSWSTPDNTSYVKDGAQSIRTLGSSVDTTLFTALGGAYPGLRLIKKQTIGSGVASVTVTGAFSATYENYVIQISGGVSSTTSRLDLKLGATATGYYYAVTARPYSAGSVSYAQGTNASAYAYAGRATTNGINSNVQLFSPFTAKPTVFKSDGIGISSVDEYIQGGGYLDNTTSYTDFTITPSTGTITGGTIYVYGYGIS